MTYKAGDRVIYNNKETYIVDASNQDFIAIEHQHGWEGKEKPWFKNYKHVIWDRYWQVGPDELKLAKEVEGTTVINKTKETNMINLSQQQEQMLTKDQKALFQSGLVSSNMDLTTEGQTALLMIMFAGNHKEMVTRANNIIKAEKEE